MMKTMKSVGVVTALCAVAVMANAHAGQGSDGVRMIGQCLGYAAIQKYPPMTVAVIDATGTLVAFQRQDDASPATADAALLKARTSLKLNASTVDLGPAVAADAPTRDAFLIMQLTTLPGGVPLTDEAGHAIGAVGVSGGGPDQDAECARRAAAPAQTRKK